MPGDESDAGIDHFPHPTPSEWRKRTWYGRFRLVLISPMWLLSVAVIVALEVAFFATAAIVLRIPYLAGKIYFALKDAAPEVYKNAE